MKMRKSLIAAAVGCFAFAGLALAQSYPPPQVQSIGSSDLFQDVVQGVGQAESYYATSAQMGAYGSTLNGGNWDNALIGGDFAQNLFQRGTSVSTAGTTYYVAYGADRWFTWGGTSTPTTMTQQTGAGDFPVKTSASYRINKASLTGTAQICTSQIVESSYGYRMQGQTVEFTFDAKAGAGFSAASSNLAVYVSTGTVADEGSTYMAYGLNAHGGAGTTAWTGQKNFGGTGGFLIPISTNWTRYGVAVPIASTANEVGVSICYTPVGTGGATDWFEFAKAQLDINPALTPVVGSAGIILAQNDPRQKSYSHRPTGVEAQLQYRYYYEVKESGTSGAIQGTGGAYDTTTTCSLMFPLPAAMRVVPTYDIQLAALSATTFKVIPTTITPVVLASTFAFLQVGASTTTEGVVSFKTTAETQYTMCTLEAVGGGGAFAFYAEE